MTHGISGIALRPAKHMRIAKFPMCLSNQVDYITVVWNVRFIPQGALLDPNFMRVCVQVAELFEWLEAAAVQKQRDDERLVALEVRHGCRLTMQQSCV